MKVHELFKSLNEGDDYGGTVEKQFDLTNEGNKCNW